jgi:D-glycero-D-manno-heptose 1,7-bisphosphate phosphatase
VGVHGSWGSQLSPGRARAALFLDRDGVLNDPVWDPHTGTTESPLRVEDVILAVGAAAAVRRAALGGLPLVIVSNQPAAAKGVVTLDDLQHVHARVLELLAAEGARIDASYLCWHHPAGTVASLAVECACRKPAPGLLTQAADDLRLDLSRSWLIGDTDADAGAGHRAGLAGVTIVRHPLSAHRRGTCAEGSPLSVDTTAEAIDMFLRNC